MTSAASAAPASSAAAIAEPPAPAAAVAKPARLRFDGNRSDYWRLMIRGNALQAVTLGLYRFWLFSDMRRFLWAAVEVDAENFEYTGTAGELLIGFLMALGILVPVNLVLFYALLETGTPVQSMIIFVVLYGFGQFAVFRARAYRLTRTVLHGLRFRQTGSGIVFAIRAMLWWIAILLTLGLAAPFMEASQERYKMRHTWFGDLGGRFDGSGWQLLLRGILPWAGVIGPLIYMLARIIQSADWAAVRNLKASADLAAIEAVFGGPSRFQELSGTIALALIWSGLIAAVLYPAYGAIVMRWWLDGLRLGKAAAASDLRMRRFYGAYLRYLWYVLVFTIALSMAESMAGGIVIGGLAGIIDFGGNSTLGDAVVALLGIGAYVIYILGCSTIYAVVVRMRLWQLATESVTVSGLAALDNVRARPAHASALGEGLADALGTGGL